MIGIIISIGIFSAAIYLLIILYLIIGIIRTNTEVTDTMPSVSVIVAAHNESQNIDVCLDAIINQDYPNDKMEIIIVNDRSEDDTGIKLSKYEKEHSYLHVITIDKVDEGQSPKKYALSQAVANAKGEIIATTDADCKPRKHWLTMLSANFTPDTGMVVGLAPLEPTTWWISPFVCIDAMIGSIIAFGSLGWNHAVTCTGRNFSYRKQLFDEIQGFTEIDNILTGDDDLFMMKASRKTNWNIRFISDAQAAVTSFAPNGWRHFATQRKRHISASKYFSLSVKIGFSLFYLSKLFMMIYLLLSIFFKIAALVPLVLIITAYFITFITLMILGYKNGQGRLIILYPLWEIYYLMNNFLLGPLGLIGPITWGKRNV